MKNQKNNSFTSPLLYRLDDKRRSPGSLVNFFRKLNDLAISSNNIVFFKSLEDDQISGFVPNDGIAYKFENISRDALWGNRISAYALEIESESLARVLARKLLESINKERSEFISITVNYGKDAYLTNNAKSITISINEQ